MSNNVLVLLHRIADTVHRITQQYWFDTHIGLHWQIHYVYSITVSMNNTRCNSMQCISLRKALLVFWSAKQMLTNLLIIQIYWYENECWLLELSTAQLLWKYKPKQNSLKNFLLSVFMLCGGQCGVVFQRRKQPHCNHIYPHACTLYLMVCVYTWKDCITTTEPSLMTTAGTNCTKACSYTMWVYIKAQITLSGHRYNGHIVGTIHY